MVIFVYMKRKPVSMVIPIRPCADSLWPVRVYVWSILQLGMFVPFSQYEHDGNNARKSPVYLQCAVFESIVQMIGLLT